MFFYKKPSKEKYLRRDKTHEKGLQTETSETHKSIVYDKIFKMRRQIYMYINLITKFLK